MTDDRTTQSRHGPAGGRRPGGTVTADDVVLESLPRETLVRMVREYSFALHVLEQLLA